MKKKCPKCGGNMYLNNFPPVVPSDKARTFHRCSSCGICIMDGDQDND